MMRIRVRLKDGLAYCFGDYRFIYESKYFHLPIVEYSSEGVQFVGQSATRRGQKDDLSSRKRRRVRYLRFPVPPLSKRNQTLI